MTRAVSGLCASAICVFLVCSCDQLYSYLPSVGDAASDARVDARVDTAIDSAVDSVGDLDVDVDLSPQELRCDPPTVVGVAASDFGDLLEPAFFGDMLYAVYRTAAGARSLYQIQRDDFVGGPWRPAVGTPSGVNDPAFFRFQDVSYLIVVRDPEAGRSTRSMHLYQLAGNEWQEVEPNTALSFGFTQKDDVDGPTVIETNNGQSSLLMLFNSCEVPCEHKATIYSAEPDSASLGGWKAKKVESLDDPNWAEDDPALIARADGSLVVVFTREDSAVTSGDLYVAVRPKDSNDLVFTTPVPVRDLNEPGASEYAPVLYGSADGLELFFGRKTQGVGKIFRAKCRVESVSP